MNAELRATANVMVAAGQCGSSAAVGAVVLRGRLLNRRRLDAFLGKSLEGGFDPVRLVSSVLDDLARPLREWRSRRALGGRVSPETQNEVPGEDEFC